MDQPFVTQSKEAAPKEMFKDKAFVKPATGSNVLCLRNERNQTWADTHCSNRVACLSGVLFGGGMCAIVGCNPLEANS